MRNLRGACLASLAWPEAEARLDAGAVPVITIGAGSKAHGFHLPLDTDLRQATWLGQAMACRWPVLVWPALGYGYYPAFVQYPGSVSIDADTFAATLRAILASIRAHTSAPIMIVNTGISTIGTIDDVASANAVHAVHVHRGAHVERVRAARCQQRHGGHGDEAETAVMRFIAPDAVDMRKAAPFDSAPSAGVLSREPGTPTYTPQGVWGRPDLGTAETGRALLAAMLCDIRTAWDQIHADS